MIKIIEFLNENRRILRDDMNIMNIGCGDGEIIKYVAKIVRNGMIYGIEFNPEYKDKLRGIVAKYPNIDVIRENPFLHVTYEKIPFQVDLIINSIGMEMIRTFQVVENSLHKLKENGYLLNIFRENYNEENIKLAKNFVERLPLKSTEFFNFKDKLVSLSMKDSAPAGI